jgi:class 3 adenylate cyclase
MDHSFHDAIVNWIIVSLTTFNITSGIFTYSAGSRKTPASTYTLVIAILSAFYSVIVATIPLGLYKLDIHLFMFGFAPFTFIGPVLFLLIDSYVGRSKKINGRSLWILLPGFSGTLFSLATIGHSEQELIALVESYADRNFLNGQTPSLLLWMTFSLALFQQIMFYLLAFFRALYAHTKSISIDGSNTLLLLAIAGGPLVVGTYDVLIMVYDFSVNSTLVLVGCSALYALLLFKNSQMDRDHLRQAERQREDMMRYLPEDLVVRLQNNTSASLLSGQRGIGTVMFCDIRNFTKIAESLDPMQVTAILNDYFTEMNRIIFKHGGIVNKYIGDAIMVVFGLLDRETYHPDVSIRCAIEMFQRLKVLNVSWQAEGRPEINIGIGIHRGQLIHGNVGSLTRMEYTVIGDTVNTASRIAGLNRQLGEPLLFTTAVLENIHEEIPGIVKVGDLDLKGKDKKVRVFCVHSQELQRVCV